jgi:tetratricopeptide (TPR) repeat protein
MTADYAPSPNRSMERTLARSILLTNGDSQVLALKTVAEAVRTSTGERFVGRARELRRVRAMCTGASRGQGALVVVSGEAGIGKTRFCEEVADQLRGDGMTVIVARCWVDGGAPALWPWQPILTELCGPDAAELLASASTTSTSVDPDRFARFSAVTDRLTATCQRTPVCLIIDDIHGADVGTLLLTRFVARSLQRLPLALVLSRRSGEPIADGLETRLLDQIEGEAAPVALHHFDLDETTAFLAAHGLRDLDPDLVLTLMRVTDGNPLFLRRIAATGGSTSTRRLPQGLTAAIDQAIGGLSPATQRVLMPAAVLGLTPSVAEAAAVAQTTPTAVLDAVDEATRVGLVAEASGTDRFSFSHELVRSALEDALGSAARLDAHARAAPVVAGDGPAIPPNRLARRAHHARAAAPRSAADAHLAVSACRAAAQSMVDSFAYEQADTLLSAAVELHQPPSLGAPAVDLLVEWAQAALLCGRLGEARTRFDRAATAAESERDPVLFAEAALGLGGHWLNEHRAPVDRARVLGWQRSALVQLPESQVALRCRLTARLAAEAVYDGGPIEPVEQALADTRRLCGDSAALAEALSLSHHALLTPDHGHRRLALADELVRVASEAGHGVLALLGLCWRAADLFLLGDTQAIRALEELRERADVLACQSILYIVEALDVMLLIRAGKLDLAEKRAEAAFELGVEVGEVDALGYLGAHTLAIRWIQGRDIELLEAAEQVAASPTLIQAEFAFRATAALIAARAGHVDRARTALDHLATGGLAALPQSSSWLLGMAVIVEAAAVLADLEIAREAYQLLLPFADLPTMASLGVVCLGPTERVLGLAALTFGDVDLAVQHLERAVTACRRLGNRPLVAIASANLAAALARRGQGTDRARAVGLFDEAIDEAEEMGMTGRVELWRTEARRAGRGGLQAQGVIRREGSNWLVALDGRRVLVNDMVGMGYLSELLTHPGTLIPALVLAGSTFAADNGTPQELLDDEARAAYAARVRELSDELAEAEAHTDLGRADRLRVEIDVLIDQIEEATGLGGRPRSFTSSHERARTSVRKAIKRAVDQIDEADPEIGRALRATISTGSTCVYTPDPEAAIRWSTSGLAR